jgi:hypothetical protein
MSTGWTIWVSYPGKDKIIFRPPIYPYLLWGTLSIYASRGMFLGVKRPGLEADHSPPFSSEVKTMELHFHSPYTPSRPVQTQFYFYFIVLYLTPLKLDL